MAGENEIYQNLDAAIRGNPHAEEAFKRRMHLNTDEEVQASLHTIAHDLSKDATFTRALKDKMFHSPEEAYAGANAAFDKGLARDVPDEGLRHLIAEQAANRYVERVKHTNPHHDEALVAVMREEIPMQVDASIDDFKAGLRDRLGQRLPAPVADAIAASVEQKIALDPDALRRPLSEALTEVYTKRGFLEETPAQQRAEINAAVQRRLGDNFGEIFPIDGAISGMANQATDAVRNVTGIDLNPVKDAVHNTAKDVITTFMAEEVSNRAVPGSAQGTGHSVMQAVNVGLGDIQQIAGAVMRTGMDRGGRNLG